RDRKREYPPATDRWFVVERREAEARLVRAHTSTLQRMAQRSRARRRDAEIAREGDAAHVAAAQPQVAPESADHSCANAPSSLRGAQRRSNPEPRERRLSRGPGLLRSARNDGVSETTTGASARCRNEGVSE